MSASASGWSAAFICPPPPSSAAMTWSVNVQRSQSGRCVVLPRTRAHLCQRWNQSAMLPTGAAAIVRQIRSE
jgi:hypothetical protein